MVVSKGFDAPVKAYDVVFFDLDGTLHLSGKPFAGLADFINECAEAFGTKFVAVTNNTSVPPLQYSEKLLKMGLKEEAFELCSPLCVLAEASEGDIPRELFAVATSDVREYLQDHGFNPRADDAKAVLVTFDTDLNYGELTVACQLLHEGAPLYSTHIDLRCPTSNGFVPDCGAITNMLSSVSGVEPVRDFGKPSKEMAGYLRRKYLSDDASAVMVGDRLYTDIALGHSMGVDSALVLSGEVKSGNEISAGAVRPTHVYPTFLEFLQDCYNPRSLKSEQYHAAV